LQADELKRFFEALVQEPNEAMRDFFMLSLLTGARRANVLAMRWSEISFERKEWQIPRTKNGDPQTITLTDEAIQVLKERKSMNDELDKHAQSQFVFPGEGKTGHLAEPCKGWLRTLERAGLEDLRIHDLRRTLGSWQAKTGASLVIIGKSLNHKHHSTTQVYGCQSRPECGDDIGFRIAAVGAMTSLYRSRGEQLRAAFDRG
jgi:integrase